MSAEVQKALGCMIEQQHNEQSEPYLKAYPSNDDTCSCYNYFGSTCHAVCGKVSAYQRVMASGSRVTANCPAGLQVLGCGFDFTGSTSELFPQVYPFLAATPQGISG